MHAHDEKTAFFNKFESCIEEDILHWYAHKFMCIYSLQFTYILAFDMCVQLIEYQ